MICHCLLMSEGLTMMMIPDECKERRGEVDLALVVQRHVHPDQLLVGQPVRTLGPEPQRWIHVLQHVVHLRVVDTSSA